MAAPCPVAQPRHRLVINKLRQRHTRRLTPSSFLLPPYSFLLPPSSFLFTPYSLLLTPSSFLLTPYSLLLTPFSFLLSPYSFLLSPFLLFSFLLPPSSLLLTPFSFLLTPFLLSPSSFLLPPFLLSQNSMGSAANLLRSPWRVMRRMPVVASLLAHESGHLLVERTAAGFLTDDGGVDSHYVGGVD